MTLIYALPNINGARVGDYVIVDILNEPDQSYIKCASDAESLRLPNVFAQALEVHKCNGHHMSGEFHRIISASQITKGHMRLCPASRWAQSQNLPGAGDLYMSVMENVHNLAVPSLAIML